MLYMMLLSDLREFAEKFLADMTTLTTHVMVFQLVHMDVLETLFMQ